MPENNKNDNGQNNNKKENIIKENVIEKNDRAKNYCRELQIKEDSNLSVEENKVRFMDKISEIREMLKDNNLFEFTKERLDYIVGETGIELPRHASR